MTYYTLPNCRMNLFPKRLVGREPGLLAAYDCNVEGSPGRIIDKTGNGYDLVTRVGTPLIGQGGGVYVNDSDASYYNGVFVPVGSSLFSYEIDCAVDSAPAALRVVWYNGNHRPLNIAAITGAPHCSFDGGGTVTTAAFGVAGRGPFRSFSSFDGANQFLVINGRLVDSDAVVPVVPAGINFIGRHGTTSLAKVYSIRRTVAQARASYVRDFASKALWTWKPQVGESSADIATGSTASGNGCSGDDWVCPAGGNGLRLVWSRIRNQLMLVDDNNARRLQWSLRRPCFGTWWMRSLVRAVGNTPRFALINVPGADPTAAGSLSYRTVFTSGAVASTLTFHRENGAAQITVNGPAAPVGSVVDTWLTHHPDGNWRAGFAVDGVWAYNDAQVAQDVTNLTMNNIVLTPGGDGILHACYFQGEMRPGELDWQNAPRIFPEALVLG